MKIEWEDGTVTAPKGVQVAPNLFYVITVAGLLLGHVIS